MRNSIFTNLFLIKRILFYLDAKRKRSFKLLCILILIVSLAEMFSVASIVPLLVGLDNNTEYLRNHYGLGIIINFVSGFIDLNNMLIISGIIFILFVVSSSLIRVFTLWFSGKLSAQISIDISKKVYEKTLFSPYINLISKNNSEQLNILIIQLGRLAPLVNLTFILLANLFVIIFLIGILLFIDYKVTIISIFLIGFLYLLLIAKTKNLLYKIGKKQTDLNQRQIRNLQNDLSGIKDILMNNNQNKSIDSFLDIQRELRNSQFQCLFLLAFPRYVFEGLIISGMVLLAFIIFTLRSGTATIFPVIGAITLGALKIIPSLQAIFSSLGAIQTQKDGLERIFKVLDNKTNRNVIPNRYFHIKKLTFSNFIEFRNIKFNYPNSNKKILDEVNLKIHKCELLGIYGPNGSGKSTFIEIIMGLIEPNNGEILVDGVNLYSSQDKNLIYRYRASISYVSQAVFIGEKTILEYITYEVNQNNVNTEKLEKIAYQLDINNFITELKEGYNTLIRDTSLSGGQRQKIALARALYKDSDIIILDEVTNNLDIESQNNLVNIINRLKGKVTIILVSHKKNILELCDTLYKLNKSKLIKI